MRPTNLKFLQPVLLPLLLTVSLAGLLEAAQPDPVMDAMKAETQLLFASDWPHWDFDLPSSITSIPFLNEQAKRNILGLNAAKLFNLEVPEGKRGKAPAEMVPAK